MKHPFDYHAPSSQQIADIATIRQACKNLHTTILEMRDAKRLDGRCAALAITKLEEVSMWANKAVVMSDEGPIA